MESKKFLIFSTLAASLFLFGAATGYELLRPSAPAVVIRSGALTIGNPSAPIEIVLVEDFQCKKCRVFSQKIIPQIQKVYIDTGKARLTLIPVSFLTGSQALANAALEIYAQNPDQLFPFLNATHSYKGGIKKGELLRLVQRMGKIDLGKVSRCIEQGCHNQELNQNLNWARELMGFQFRTPALYINGSPASTFSFEAIQYQIEGTK